MPDVHRRATSCPVRYRGLYQLSAKRQERPQLPTDAEQKDREKDDTDKTEIRIEDRVPKKRKGKKAKKVRDRIPGMSEPIKTDKTEPTIDQKSDSPRQAADNCKNSTAPVEERAYFWRFLPGLMARLPEDLEPPPDCVHRFCEDKKAGLGAALATAAWGRLREIEFRCQDQFQRLDAAIGNIEHSLEQHLDAHADATTDACHRRVQADGDLLAAMDTLQRDMNEIAKQLSEVRGRPSEPRRLDVEPEENIRERSENKVTNLWELQAMVNRAVGHQCADARLTALEEEVAELQDATKSRHVLIAVPASSETWSITAQAQWEAHSHATEGVPPVPPSIGSGSWIQVETIGATPRVQKPENEGPSDIDARSCGDVDSHHASHEAPETIARSRKQWRPPRTTKKSQGKDRARDKRVPMASIAVRGKEISPGRQTEEFVSEDVPPNVATVQSEYRILGPERNHASKPERWSDMIPE
jgi:hypothetical protein